MNPRKTQIRSLVLDILSGRENVQYSPTKKDRLKSGVAELLARAAGKLQDTVNVFPQEEQLNSQDALLFAEVFQDLLTDKIITPGMDEANPELPYFRVHSDADLSPQKSD
ncbi:MAG: hypothetical protein QOE70_1605 [Chthoniobacter sp.]|jgi:hypothetical protein|nr:hypothetical protein [Chthoniobacter sp.]